jgi:hypothetical protein
MLQHVGDVEVQRAVGIDRFVVPGAEVADRVVADGVPGGALGVDRVLEVAGGGEDAGVDDEAVAVRLRRLVVVLARVSVTDLRRAPIWLQNAVEDMSPRAREW